METEIKKINKLEETHEKKLEDSNKLGIRPTPPIDFDRSFNEIGFANMWLRSNDESMQMLFNKLKKMIELATIKANPSYVG